MGKGRCTLCKLMFSYGDKMKTATAKVGGIMQNIERKRECFQEKYSKVCITRAAVNENVCEDSHTITHYNCVVHKEQRISINSKASK